MTTTDSRLLDKEVAERAGFYNKVYEEGGKIYGTTYREDENGVWMIIPKEIPRYSEEPGRLINNMIQRQMEWYQEFVDALARDEKPVETLSARETCEALLTFLDHRERR